MNYMPENFYPNEVLNEKQLEDRFINNKLVSFEVSHWDNEKRALVVNFANGIVGIIPENEICIEKPKFIGNFNYSVQANALIGKTACALITKIDKNEVTLSRKKLQELAFETLKVDTVYNVCIKNISPIGLFVDVAVGICGFIHNSEISKTQFNSIEDFKRDFGLHKDHVIPAKLICTKGNIKLSFRQLFRFPILVKGDCVYATVRNPLNDGTGYFVDISPNDTAIVDIDTRLYYGSKILVEIKSSEIVFDGGNYFTKHHVKFIAG